MALGIAALARALVMIGSLGSRTGLGSAWLPSWSCALRAFADFSAPLQSVPILMMTGRDGALGGAAADLEGRLKGCMAAGMAAGMAAREIQHRH
jgi:hypothetical protein